MLGLSREIFVECPSCHRGRNLDLFERQAAKDFRNLDDQFECHQCKNKISYFNGITQALISTHTVIQWRLISNIELFGTAEIEIGIIYKVMLPQEVPVINKIFLTCVGGGVADVYPITNSSQSFRILSCSGNKEILGNKIKLDWQLLGRTNDVEGIPVWIQSFVLAKEEFLQKQYSLSLLTSAITLESFVDHLVGLSLSKKINQEVSEVILDSMRGVEIKLKILKELNSVDFHNSANIEKSKIKNLFEIRNKIAHGKKTVITENEALDALETSVRTIIYLLQQGALGMTVSAKHTK